MDYTDSAVTLRLKTLLEPKCVYMQGWYEVKMWNIPGIYGK